MSGNVEELVTAVERRSRRHLKGLGTPIEIGIGLSKSYSGLLRGEFENAIDVDALLKFASRSGRVILSARGGSGKTTVMNRLAVAAAKSGRIPVLVELSRWTADATEAWEALADSPRQAADFILARFGAAHTSLGKLDAISPDVERVLLLDGLNEVPGAVADEILDLADRLAALMIRCSVIVSDRLVRRRLEGDDDRWVFAAPLRVRSEEINRLVRPDQVPAGGDRLLGSPFFVDRAIRGELAASALATIRAHVEGHGGLPPGLLNPVAEGAFEAYRIDESRTFSPARFRDAGAEAAIDPMMQSGLLLRQDDDRMAFTHHWYHDYLASLHVIGRRDLLGPDRRHEILDALTFEANSFDAIAFALEQLPGAEAERFLRAVYDWNPYAAGYALAEVEASSDRSLSSPLRTVMLAMLADKLFDRHYLSRRKAADALDLFRDDEAIRLRSAESREALVKLIQDSPKDGPKFEEWRNVFALAPGADAPQDIVSALTADDSIVGWTAANVLKRLVLAEDQLRTIITAAIKSNEPVVRWRASHVLGGRTAPAAINALLDRLENDLDEYVRYGAVRSLVETASVSEELSISVLDRLQPLVPIIAKWPRVMAELTKAVFLSPGEIPPNWSERISDLLYPQALASGDLARLEEWSRLTADLREHERLHERIAA
jgi:hypothetical protein